MKMKHAVKLTCGWAMALLLSATPSLIFAADPQDRERAAAKELTEFANLAEERLSDAVSQRLSEHRGSEPRLNAGVLVELIDMSRTYANDRCVFLRDVFKANGKNIEGSSFEYCVAALRMENIGAIAQYGELSLGVPFSQTSGSEEFCKNASADLNPCSEPVTDREFGEKVRGSESKLREQVQVRDGIFGAGTDLQARDISGDFDRAQSELDALVDRSCSFARNIRIHSAPPWVQDRCETFQRDGTIYISFGFLSELNPK